MEQLKQRIASLPEQPGIYKFLDKGGRILYVGKAKNLKKRVASYLNRTPERPRVQQMLRKAVDLDYVVVDSEAEALLLENNLIKKYQPRYNVMLRDGKSYPFIAITAEPFPRIIPTRRFIRDGTEYYGPFPSMKMVRGLMEFFQKHFPTRSCRFRMNEDDIAAGKYRVCLDYHIGLCKAPCVGYQSREHYLTSVQQIRRILSGHIGQVIRETAQAMQAASDRLDFETAQELYARLQALEKFQSRTSVVDPSLGHLEVIALHRENELAVAVWFRVFNGFVVQSDVLEMIPRLEESDAELMSYAVTHFHGKHPPPTQVREAVVSELPSFVPEGIRYFKPERGPKRDVLRLAKKNAIQHLTERMQYLQKVQTDSDHPVLRYLQRDLGLRTLPHHIECFDNSHLQGRHAVSAMVCFINGYPAKSNYRKYHLRKASPRDDYAAMAEVVERRYQRLLREGKPLPQLILIDGGKGQLSAAVTVLKHLGIADRIDVRAIAKKLDLIYHPEDPQPLYLPRNSPSLRLLQHIRNEAHRFAITFHRHTRTKQNLTTTLTEIPGIGPKTAALLLREFGSITRILAASEQDISDVIGPARARILITWLKEKS